MPQCFNYCHKYCYECRCIDISSRSWFHFSKYWRLLKSIINPFLMPVRMPCFSLQRCYFIFLQSPTVPIKLKPVPQRAGRSVDEVRWREEGRRHIQEELQSAKTGKQHRVRAGIVTAQDGGRADCGRCVPSRCCSDVIPHWLGYEDLATRLLSTVSLVHHIHGSSVAPGRWPSPESAFQECAPWWRYWERTISFECLSKMQLFLCPGRWPIVTHYSFAN